MNVFISWSGDLSKKLASELNDWIPTVIQAVKPFFSPDDIKKGEFWTGKLREELKSNSTGILCMTHENLHSPWIHFEAGSLTNSIGKGRLCPLLFDIEITEIKGPLSLFNVTVFKKDEIKKLINSINSDLETKLDDKVVERVFELMWPEFEDKVNSILKNHSGQNIVKEKTRTDSDMIKEILILLRDVTNNNERMLMRFEERFDNLKTEPVYRKNNQAHFEKLERSNSIVSLNEVREIIMRYYDDQLLQKFRTSTVSDLAYDFDKRVSPILSSRHRKFLMEIDFLDELGKITASGIDILTDLFP